ncbi:glycosyltransferase family 4 protein [Anaerolineales bacterium HSG24]|nr:glycosyltransferase family 4 protein [Anaerolineales bacterium HSG24]
MPHLNKILYTTTSYLPAIGGAQLHTHRIAQRIANECSVQVLTHWDEHRTDWLLGTTLCAPTTPKFYVYDGVPVERIALTRSERYRLWPYVFGYYAIKGVAISKIAAVLRPKIHRLAQGVDLIQNSRIGREPLSFASLQVARQLDVPFVFVPYHHPRWVGWNYRQYLDLYRQADALIALTEAEKQTLIQLGVSEARIFVTGNGPNVADHGDGTRFRQKYQIPDKVPMILFLGQKYRYKGISYLLEATRLVWQSWPDSYFVFIGPQTRYSQKMFQSVPQSEQRIIEIGTVDLQTKTDALSACTLLCVPSNQESFGGVYTEAWMFNKPVIGVDIPAVREVIDDEINGYLVSQNTQSIACRINHLLAHPETATSMGQAGRQKVISHYNWDTLAKKTAEIYQRVISRY